MKRPAKTLPPVRDTYWDPQLSRLNLGEPVFGNLAHVTGLANQMGAGRAIVTVEEDEDVRRFLLQRARMQGGKVTLELGRPDHAPSLRPLRAGQVVRLSWSHEQAWWGCHVHVLEAHAEGLSLEFPRTVYRFPVRAQMWASVSGVARMFEGFDVTHGEAPDGHPLNHRQRIAELLGAAIEQGRPALLYLTTPGTFFPGLLQLTPGTDLKNSVRFPRTLDFALAGTDMVGVGWRTNQPVAISVVVNGLTLGFRTKTAGGMDQLLSLSWPELLLRRQRRSAPRIPVGSKELVDFRMPLRNALGAQSGEARPFRVLDVGPGGVGLIFDQQTAAELGRGAREAEVELYGRVHFTINLEIVARVPFGNGHVRLCCAFRGLEQRQQKAIDVLCQKLGGVPHGS